MIKDESEVELMRRAAKVAKVGIETAAATLKPGTSENEVGGEIEYAMRKGRWTGSGNTGVRQLRCALRLATRHRHR